MAGNAANTLNAHYGRLAVSTQRLSSGLRVNSAADDAAGLAIRELMRADVAALHQGVRNANDAISMIQVADGALAVIDEKLIRMKELAEQAATGTYDSTQRLMIDSEFQAMGAEINRIANATDFNGIKLLDGKFSRAGGQDVEGADGVPQIVIGKDGQAYEVTLSQSWNGMNGAHVTSPASVAREAFGDPADLGEGEFFIELTNSNFAQVYGKDQYLHVTYEGWYAESVFLEYDPDAGWGVFTNLNRPTPAYTVTGDASGAVFDFPDSHGTLTVKVLNGEYASTSLDAYTQSTLINLWENRTALDGTTHNIPGIYPGMGTTNTFSQKPNESTFRVTVREPDGTPFGRVRCQFHLAFETPSGNAADFRDLTYTFSVKKADDSLLEEEGSGADIADEVIIHFGPGNDAAEDKYAIKKGDVTLGGLGLKDVSVQTQEAGQQALTAIDEAIAKKDQLRAYYGAMQNRLENTVTNLTIQAENLQASESRISDADIAAEMTQFVRNQVLTQTATAMLGQANSYPRLLMSLLTG